MTLFQDIDLRLKLDNLEIIQHFDDRVDEGVEPYIIPIFFKVDGLRYEAFLRIYNTQQPEDNTTQVEETTEIQLQLLSNPSQEPLLFRPTGPILRHQTLYARPHPHSVLRLPDVEFRTRLRPIPLVIDVAGLISGREFIEKFYNYLDGELGSSIVPILNLLSVNVPDFIAETIGLDNEIESCPDLSDLDIDELANTIDTQFRCLIPGFVGGVFVAMENDAFDEDDVETLSTAIEEQIKQTINDATNSVARVNPIPDTDDIEVDPEELKDEITSQLVDRFDVPFWFIATIGELWGDRDEFVGFCLKQYSHLDIDPAGEGDRFSERLTGERNIWELNGQLEVL